MINRENRNFFVVNAFTNESFGGNPAAIFTRGEGFTDREMQLIARQLNLVETVFVISDGVKDADRQLRYFTPLKEVPIAGHPTVAAWTALALNGEINIAEQSCYTQKTKAGIQTIEISKENNLYLVSMRQPSPKFLSIAEDRAQVAGVFNLKESDLIEDLPIQAVHTGLGHVIIPIKNLESLMRAQRNIEPLKKLCTSLGAGEAQLFCFETFKEDLDLHTRNLCPREGVEDPACGVGNGALGAYLSKHKFKDQKVVSFKAEQGHVVDMPSLISVRTVMSSELEVYVGGSAVLMLRGTFESIS